MELEVMVALQRSGAARRREVIFAALADEEAGGQHGALHWVQQRPDLFADAAGQPAAAALNEVGGYSITLNGRRSYAIQVAEKGIVWTRVRASGTPSHGSMPSPDNAAIKLATAITRLAGDPRPARVIPVVRGFFDGLGLGNVAELAARVTRPRHGQRSPTPWPTRSCGAPSTPCCATRSPPTSSAPAPR